MATHHTTEAFVFKKEDRMESDRMFSVFTKEYGKMEITAKAIRKINAKLRGGIEMFSVSQIEFVEGKNKKILTDTLFLQKFNNIPQSPEKFQMAQDMARLLDDFMKGQLQDERIFDFLKETFSLLNSCQPVAPVLRKLRAYFAINLIFLLGYGPEVFQCASCHGKLNPYGLYFSNKDGGVICKSCAILQKDALKLTSDIVKMLRLMVKKDWQMVSKITITPNVQHSLENILNQYGDYILHSNSFLNKVRS